MHVQFEGMTYQQIVDIPIGTKADLFLYCCWRNFVTNLHKFTRFDQIDMLTIALHVLTIYLQLINLN